MDIAELLNYRKTLLDDCKDDDGTFSESNLVNNILDNLLDAKIIDNVGFNDSYFYDSTYKLNGYLFNESQERLQVFIVNEHSFNHHNELLVSSKEVYENEFSKAYHYVNAALKNNDINTQDGSAINALTNFLRSAEGKDQIEVIEIFLVSLTATVQLRGEFPTVKKMIFSDEKIKTTYDKSKDIHASKLKASDKVKVNKEIEVYKKLIDLNYLYNVYLSQGEREVLVIDFDDVNGQCFDIEVLKAADEQNFESYLTVLPADFIAALYKRYSSRLLEKNVRSFLQFKGVNGGMRKTLTNEPEKFIAYNNGLTITATNKEVIERNGKLYLKKLEDFQIVNGGQTTASIFFSKKDNIDISKVKIMAKINVAKNISEDDLNDLISNISQFSNSQTKVTAVDLKSRNPQLEKIKSLSESIITPLNNKWFFEKSKGDFSTKLRIAGPSKKRMIEKEFPKERRLTKDQLGKYYCSWGDEPYQVKKGGEAIFRKFIENISSEINETKVNVNRDFYEDLISKVILFRSLESLHGAGKNAIGQLRSAVVPYTISLIHHYYYEVDKKSKSTFDFSRLWKSEKLEYDLEEFFFDLMKNVNIWLKKYATSDDVGENTKKEPLWIAIKSSVEVKSFFEEERTQQILDKYAISIKEYDKKLKGSKSELDVDFKLIKSTIAIHEKGVEYYQKIKVKFYDHLTEADFNKIEKILISIKDKRTELTKREIDFDESIVNRISRINSDLLNELNHDDEEQLLTKTIDYIIKHFQKSNSNKKELIQNFSKIGDIAAAKNAIQSSVYHQIGIGLSTEKAPTIGQVYNASNYIKLL